jgi:formate/nitrite transporter FocA (FNT family)
VIQANEAIQHENPEEDLTDKEKDEVDRRTLIRAAVTHETVRRQGEDELERTTLALLISGLAAGMAIGFSMIAQGVLKAHLPDAEWSRLVSKLGYCAGFLIVILGRKQLYTENTLTAVVPLLNRREAKAFLNVVRLLSVVLLANLIGAHLFAWFAAKAPVLDESVRVAIREIGHEALKGRFLETMCKGILAGWLIALIPWLSPAAATSRIGVITFLTYLVGIGQFSHVVAGSVDVLYNVMDGSVAWSHYALNFLIPTAVGNTLGGVVLVALLNYSQVAAD